MKIVAIKQVKITTNMNCSQKCSKEFINKAVIIQVQVLYIIVFIDIARVYFYSKTDYIRQTDIKLTSSNGYKSQKFVSLIDTPYFKNVFTPGASIRRNTVL